tara:strand:- start:417 stop:608 length:192 start_codon:yes stop_codon:yes gene_type:complete
MTDANKENYYNKYQYLIWIDKKGFIELDKFSTKELLEFERFISSEIKNRRAETKDVLMDDKKK